MRILIVDPEYLVAMEAERILEAALDCETHIAMPRDYPTVLETRNFDVVLVHASLVRSPEAVHRLTSVESGVVLSTLLNEEVAGFPEWPGVTVVPKPFDERQLIDAIKNAARD